MLNQKLDDDYNIIMIQEPYFYNNGHSPMPAGF